MMFRLRVMLVFLDRWAGYCWGYPLAIIGSCLVAFVPRVRQTLNGSDPNASARRYAIYVTYDRRNLVADYVIGQVEALARLGYRVVVVANSRKLPPDEAAKLLRHSWRVLHRRNFGHDFGAYKDGIRQVGPPDAIESLILMNDSCYGPLFDLDVAEQRAQASEADIWAITDNWTTKYHLQSYFLRIGPRALRSPAFTRFWATLLPYQSRALTIQLGEIRFTQYMIRHGMATDVLCPYQEVARRALGLIFARISGAPGRLLSAERSYLESLANQISRGVTLNSMHSFWDVLIVEFACPFIKGNLLRRNPARIPGLIEWPSMLLNHTDYDIDLIHRHLKIH